MSAAAVLADLDVAGATVAVEGDRLRLQAPSGVLTDALHARIVAHREASSRRSPGGERRDDAVPEGDDPGVEGLSQDPARRPQPQPVAFN